MKTIFTPEDINPGIVVCRAPQDNKRPDWSYLASTCYKIGYRASACNQDERYVFVALTDGMVCDDGSKQSICDRLNEDNFVLVDKEMMAKMAEHFVRRPFFV